MAALKPWYKVVTPREDLREGKPLDASEFAVHLDQVRDKRAPIDYQKPERFFERTYLTQNLLALSAEVVRRLSGIQTETSAVFNFFTQFGGGKTHFLTLLYHLGQHGPGADGWAGVPRILDRAAIRSVPQAATAVFVGTEFDSISGRGGNDGTPLRKTPWGEIAYQLAGKEGLAVLAEHEKQMTAPANDVIRQFLPKNKSCLILIDELMNYVTFTAKGLDQHQRDIATGKAAWKATGGTIDQEGVFQAGQDEGNFLVTATAGMINGTAGVTIAKPGVLPPPIAPPAKDVTSLSWEGAIPSQKWMNFYAKVLSKLAGKGLKLTVRVEYSADGGISAQKVEELKVALQELGLEDDARVS